MEEEQQSALHATLGKALNRQLLYYLDICARCAICRDACHQYVETKDVRYLPAYRAELIRRVYKKKFNQIGRFFPALYEGREIDDQWLNELYDVTCLHWLSPMHGVLPVQHRHDADTGRGQDAAKCGRQRSADVGGAR